MCDPTYPALIRSLPKAHFSGRQKRNPDDVRELRFVPVPSDSGTHRVLIDTDLLKVVNFTSGELRNLYAKLIQKCRWVVGRPDLPPAVIVTETERNDTAVSNTAVKFERFQWQSAKGCREVFSLRSR